MNFQKIVLYISVGIVVAFLGVLFSDVAADVFNGMPYGDGANLGFGFYLCIVIVVCTGIIISHIDKK